MSNMQKKMLREHLTNVKELGLGALSETIAGNQKSCGVKLKTFHIQN